jgi:hypothetical protein
MNRCAVSLFAIGSFLGLGLASVEAAANPRPLPFTYQHEQLPEGGTEVEQFVDFTPVRARSQTSGDPVWFGLTQFQTEFEHGLTSRLELGLYFMFSPGAGTGFADLPTPPGGTGAKQRLRYQLAPSGFWPIDVALYGEVAENEREIELEAKVILQRRFDKLRLIANLTAEHEFYFDGRSDFVAAPSAGVTFEASPAVQPGIEWWMTAEYPEQDPPKGRPFQLGPHHYVGPALMLQFGNLWWTTGAYLRLDARSHRLVPGESYGSLWARTMIGFNL